MLKLFKYEGFEVKISEEALLLKPFKQIWLRDRTKSKSKALNELGFIYFFCDPRSDYQYHVDEEERMNAIIEGEGLPSNWTPDKVVKDAMDFYLSFKPISVALLEDMRYLTDKFRKAIKDINFKELDIKEFKEVTAVVKQLTSLIQGLDEAEKAVNSELRESLKMRGQGEKTIFEDDINS